MGFAISWLAAHTAAEVALESLALRSTGQRLELPTAPFVGAALSTGWYLVVANRCDHPLISERMLKPISTKADVVSCSLEEHVMCSTASFWTSGHRIWSVSHDAQRAIDHLETSGELPPFFAEVRDRLLSEQRAAGGARADVDFVFEVPLELAKRIVGFKHDEEGEPDRFDVLEPTSNSPLARPWYKLW